MFPVPRTPLLVTLVLISFALGRWGLLVAVPALVVLARTEPRDVAGWTAAFALPLHALAWYRASVHSPFGLARVFVIDEDSFATSGFFTWGRSLVVLGFFAVVVVLGAMAVYFFVRETFTGSGGLGERLAAIGLAAVAVLAVRWASPKFVDSGARFLGLDDALQVLAVDGREVVLIHAARPTRRLPAREVLALESSCVVHEEDDDGVTVLVRDEVFTVTLRSGAPLQVRTNDRGSERPVLGGGAAIRALEQEPALRHARLAVVPCEGVRFTRE